MIKLLLNTSLSDWLFSALLEIETDRRPLYPGLFERELMGKNTMLFRTPQINFKVLNCNIWLMFAVVSESMTRNVYDFFDEQDSPLLTFREFSAAR